MAASQHQFLVGMCSVPSTVEVDTACKHMCGGEGGRQGGSCLGSGALAASALPSLASATADASVESRDLRWAALRVDPAAFGLCLARSTAACSTAGLMRPAGQNPSSSASAAPLSSGALPLA